MRAMPLVRCLLVEDDHFMREALAAELSSMESIELIGAACDLEEAFAYAGPIDLVVLDLGLPGSCRRGATGAVLETWPDVKVLIVTGYATGPDVVLAFAEGARGYVTKHVDPREFQAAVRTVVNGGTYVTPTLAGHLLSNGLTLSVAERAVLRGVAEGMTDKQIALRLGIGDKAVENRLASVRQKAGLLDRSRSALTRFAADSDPFCQLRPDEHDAADVAAKRTPRAVRGRIRRLRPAREGDADSSEHDRPSVAAPR
jgi:DNA-binding NarL/FixJ family response regulator